MCVEVIKVTLLTLSSSAISPTQQPQTCRHVVDYISIVKQTIIYFLFSTVRRAASQPSNLPIIRQSPHSIGLAFISTSCAASSVLLIVLPKHKRTDILHREERWTSAGDKTSSEHVSVQRHYVLYMCLLSMSFQDIWTYNRREQIPVIDINAIIFHGDQ